MEFIRGLPYNTMVFPAESLLVAAGGASGALVRWKISSLAAGWKNEASTAYCVVAINTLGSFLLGSAFRLRQQNVISSNTFILFGTGFCGAFTTLSTFSLDVVKLLDKGLMSKAVSVIILTNVLGISVSFCFLLRLKKKHRRAQYFTLPDATVCRQLSRGIVSLSRLDGVASPHYSSGSTIFRNFGQNLP